MEKEQFGGFSQVIKNKYSDFREKYSNYKEKRKQLKFTQADFIEERQDLRRNEHKRKQNIKKTEMMKQDPETQEKLAEAWENKDWGTMMLVNIEYILKELLGGIKSGLFKYFIGPILFASLAPALPLFVFMAGLFAVIKFFMGYLKKI